MNNNDYVDITIYNFPIINLLSLESIAYTISDINLYVNKEFVINHFGTITPLSVARSHCGSATVGDFALFGGGLNIFSPTVFDVVDAYDSILTRTTPTPLSTPRAAPSTTTIGDYALFAGGVIFDSEYNEIAYNTVDAYDTSLTRSIPTVLSIARYNMASTNVGNYALFGGGNSEMSIFSNTVDVYDASLTRFTPIVLSVNKADFAATTVGDYALFGGGRSYYNSFDTVDAYNSSLTRITPMSLSDPRFGLAATTVGDYALFGGGWGNAGLENLSRVVDTYDTSLTRHNFVELSIGTLWLQAITLNGYALLGGGNYDVRNDTGGFDTIYSKIIDAFDSTLTRSTTAELTRGGNGQSVATTSSYAIFAGGSDDNIGEVFNIVDAYMIEDTETAKYTWNNRSGETWADVQSLSLENFIYKQE